MNFQEWIQEMKEKEKHTSLGINKGVDNAATNKMGKDERSNTLTLR